MGTSFWARRSAALYLLAWLMLGLLLSSLTAAATSADAGASLLFAVPLTLIYASACGFSAYYLCRAYPLATKPLGAVLRVFAFTAVSAALLWCALGSTWAALWQSLAPQWQGVTVSRPFADRKSTRLNSSHG